MNEGLPAFGPHIGLGVAVRLVADLEWALGRWPSLVADTGVLTFQIDLHPDLSCDQARAVVHGLVEAVADWEAAVVQAGACGG